MEATGDDLPLATVGNEACLPRDDQLFGDIWLLSPQCGLQAAYAFLLLAMDVWDTREQGVGECLHDPGLLLVQLHLCCLRSFTFRMRRMSLTASSIQDLGLGQALTNPPVSCSRMLLTPSRKGEVRTGRGQSAYRFFLPTGKIVSGDHQSPSTSS